MTEQPKVFLRFNGTDVPLQEGVQEFPLNFQPSKKVTDIVNALSDAVERFNEEADWLQNKGYIECALDVLDKRDEEIQNFLTHYSMKEQMNIVTVFNYKMQKKKRKFRIEGEFTCD